ncbi:MAG: hypothetical protein PHV39_01885, partial [Methanomicrobium sp.]|nr:hypothetical protein [Methanomicrobium sp.]
MLTEIAHIIVAFAVAWILFIAVDVIFRLPETGGVSGAQAIGCEIEKAGGSINGGYMMGNIVSSPDASAGT